MQFLSNMRLLCEKNVKDCRAGGKISSCIFPLQIPHSPWIIRFSIRVATFAPVFERDKKTCNYAIQSTLLKISSVPSQYAIAIKTIVWLQTAKCQIQMERQEPLENKRRYNHALLIFSVSLALIIYGI